MTNRTWIGGGNNQASNPKDWSPTGAPQPGDGLLLMNSGTMNVFNYSLPAGGLPFGDYLGVNVSPVGAGNETINLRNSSFIAVVYADQPHINLSRTNTFVLGSAYTASPVVNLEENAKWIGNFDVDYSSASLTVNGGPRATFINDSSVPGPANTRILGGQSDGFGTETINVDVAGKGGFVVDGGKLTFGGGVGAGQSVNIGGVPSLNRGGDVQVNHPRAFSGLGHAKRLGRDRSEWTRYCRRLHLQERHAKYPFWIENHRHAEPTRQRAEWLRGGAAIGRRQRPHRGDHGSFASSTRTAEPHGRRVGDSRHRLADRPFVVCYATLRFERKSKFARSPTRKLRLHKLKTLCSVTVM